MEDPVDYYKILEIIPTASYQEVRDAFRRLTKLYHPDRHSNSRQSHNRYIKIVEAFTVLSNRSRREEYDRKFVFTNKSVPYYTHTNNTETNYQNHEHTGTPFMYDSTSDTDSSIEDPSDIPPVYCPSCGQGQASIDTEYCSNCGIRLTYHYKEEDKDDLENNSSRKRRKSTHSTHRKNKPSKHQIDANKLGMTGYSLKYDDIMILGEIEYILPDYQHDIDPDIHNLIRNDIFEGIRCDKVGLVYSSKLRKFMYLAVNDNYSVAILFKSNNYHDLPNIDYIDLDNLHPSVQIIENASRSLVSVFQNSMVEDFTIDPPLRYRITRCF